MNALFIYGLLLVLSPVIFLAIYIAKKDGIKIAVTIFGSAILLFGIVWFGMYLMYLSGVFIR